MIKCYYKMCGCLRISFALTQNLFARLYDDLTDAICRRIIITPSTLNTSDDNYTNNNEIMNSAQTTTETVDSNSNTSVSVVTLQEELNANWYQDISRKESEELLFGAIDGAFVFRRTGQSGCLCTLTIMYEGTLYHLNVRIKSSNLLALGKHRKEEAEFGNLDEIVSYYSENELKLIQGAGFALVRFQPHVIYEYNQYNY